MPVRILAFVAHPVSLVDGGRSLIERSYNYVDLRSPVPALSPMRPSVFHTGKKICI